MFDRPRGVSDEQLRAVLLSAWRFDAAALDYEPVGFGSHHWTARDRNGDGRFVTVDDLHSKRRTRMETADAVCDRLRGTFTAVVELHERARLDFVVAPLRAVDGSVVARLGGRYSVVVHPLLDARPAGPDGEYLSAGDRAQVVDLLVALHGATAAARPHALRDDATLPARDALEGALAAVGSRWNGGPYGEQARRLLVPTVDDLERLLGVYDELAARVLEEPGRMVITHGEPHAGNVLVSGDRYFMVDWDTARVAPPERDLWDLAAADASVVDRYRAATGVSIDPAALAFYRLWYDLAEIGGYLKLFREDHDDSADAAESWKNLSHFLQPRERWPDLLR